MSEQGGEYKYLEMDVLNETFMNNLDIIKQVLSSFKESFESFEEEFLEAQHASDTELMSRLAHGLKGSAGNIRASGVSTKAAELQHLIDAGKQPGVLVEEVIEGLTGLLKEIDVIVEV